MRPRLLILWTLAWWMQACDSPGFETPNVILILADDQRAGTIHHLGNQEIRTPHLDRLAEQGISFENVYIMGGTHAAVCMPSRAMLHTGRPLSALQSNGRTIPQDHTMLGELLQKKGYNCFGTGKWHNGKETFNRAFNQGDEIFFGGMADHWNVPLFHYDSTGVYADRRPVIKDPFQSKEISRQKGDHVYGGVHSTDVFAKAAVDFIRNYNEQNPFFLYLSFMAPHDPRSMPGPFDRQYAEAEPLLPDNFQPKHPFDNGELMIRDETLAAHPRQEEEIKGHIRDYYAMISHMDQAIGTVLAELEGRGMSENTIVIFTGDNGLALGQHGLMGKQNLYEHSIKIPLLITGPGIRSDQKRYNFNYLHDLFPTLCELLDIPVPASVRSQSFMQAFQSDAFQGRDHLTFQYKNVQRAVRENDFKLIRYQVNDLDTLQLFNLADDPWERSNLAYLPSFQEKVQKMMMRFHSDPIETSTP